MSEVDLKVLPSQPQTEPEQDIVPDSPDQLEALVEEELLVEDVSIDGMCGVY